MFYNIFEDMCHAKGVSPTQAARENGLQQGTVSMWKRRGSTPNAATLAKLAGYFDVAIEHFLRNTVGKEASAVVDIIKNAQPDDADGYIQDTLDAVLDDEPFMMWHSARAASDEATLNAYGSMPDATIKKAMLACFDSLNRRGKIEAMEHMLALEENPRFAAGQNKRR